MGPRQKGRGGGWEEGRWACFQVVTSRKAPSQSQWPVGESTVWRRWYKKSQGTRQHRQRERERAWQLSWTQIWSTWNIFTELGKQTLRIQRSSLAWYQRRFRLLSEKSPWHYWWINGCVYLLYHWQRPRAMPWEGKKCILLYTCLLGSKKQELGVRTKTKKLQQRSDRKQNKAVATEK